MCYAVNGKVEEPAECVYREFRMVYLLIVTWEMLFSFRFYLLIGVL